MGSPFNLSLRYKLPLWGSILIVVTALVLSGSLMLQAWGDLKHDMLRNSEDLGRTMVRSLFPAMLHDNLWLAFETVSLPFQGARDLEVTHAESLIVLDQEQRVYVSSHPEDYPVLARLNKLGRDFEILSQVLPRFSNTDPMIWDHPKAKRIFVIIPIVADDVRLGSLIMAHEKAALWPRFFRQAERALWITLLVLCVLLPIDWYWGTRLTKPLSIIATRMSQIGKGVPEPLDPDMYPYRDELGLLFLAYGTMTEELRAKASLEVEMIRSERLAALGRLTASIAHEINNPLGGMLNAISTLKRHGSPDPVTQKSVALLGRGLQQIRETVAALLVEAKLKSRDLLPQDIDDVRLLVAPEAHKKQVDVMWDVSMGSSLPLPSTLVRQVLINLLLNAVEAAGQNGRVVARLMHDGKLFSISVENGGRLLSQEQMNTLFEPFSRFSESGHGLGLWISYQIVNQIGGSIRAEVVDGLTRFVVKLPMDISDEQASA